MPESHPRDAQARLAVAGGPHRGFLGGSSRDRSVAVLHPRDVGTTSPRSRGGRFLCTPTRAAPASPSGVGAVRAEVVRGRQRRRHPPTASMATVRSVGHWSRSRATAPMTVSTLGPPPDAGHLGLRDGLPNGRAEETERPPPASTSVKPSREQRLTGVTAAGSPRRACSSHGSSGAGRRR